MHCQDTNMSVNSTQFSSVQSFSHVWLFATPWTAACQATLSITNSQSLSKLMSIESVMPSNHLILCRLLLLLTSIFPNIRVFSNESALRIRSDQIRSVAESCPTLCDPINRSTPGLPVHHNYWSLLQLMSIELVMPSNRLIICRPLLLLPSIFPNIRVFSNESALCIRWPHYWSFSFNISPPNEY